ncbi:MAG TPA: sulfotransferase domain-containing protein [Nocardioidaceae bacterium]|nr:sulfotransferase domain-containing protein [Nocardioidaceae bacterium]
MESLREYVDFVSDNRRWQGFEFRDGDIVISTPAKCGTTWAQFLVALLIFDGPDLPDQLGRISPWVDALFTPLDEITARLEQQTHRRFMKTHTPLDGVPYDDRVTYIVVGRDPRDASVSKDHHAANMAPVLDQRLADAHGQEVEDGAEERALPTDRAASFRASLGIAQSEDRDDRLYEIVQHLREAWLRRDRPNVFLLHYADLQADLAGQLGRLAEALGISVSPDRVHELSRHATLTAMRSRAADYAPEADWSLWKDTTAFFRSGGSGEWRGWVDEEFHRLYAARVAELTDGDEELARWIHHGFGSLT